MSSLNVYIVVSYWLSPRWYGGYWYYSYANEHKSRQDYESLITEYPNLKITELHKIDNITDKERDDKEDYISLMNKNLELIKQELYQ